MVKNYFDVAVVGGGPAGMMAAITAAENNPAVCLIERNSHPGQKLLLTGKERCNLTSSKSVREMVEAFGLPKGKFLFSAFTQFSNENLINFFESRGVPLKIERGQRVFPQDNKASSILKCLRKELRHQKVSLISNFRVVKISYSQDYFQIFSEHKQKVFAHKVIIATGGKSYPATGSTGDGYKLAKDFGHTITELKPALVPLIVRNPKLNALSGLTLKNIRLSFYSDNQEITSLFGEMIFTHFGISGPIVLTASKLLYPYLKEKQTVMASLDFKPALTIEQLKNRLQREMETIGKKEYQSLLAQLLPKALIDLVIAKTQIDKHRKIGSLQKIEKEKIIEVLKNFRFQIDDTLPIESGIVTSGGVEPDEINSTTMASKIVPNLYFAGEIIGLDGPTGGFNLQKAFSTGWVAGKNISYQ